ncbi:phosphoenolpyruvate carboxykinase (ATP) [bacterium]|nr:phosphoenolpyruvate carboxykinase (ATP) [bacterium]
MREALKTSKTIKTVKLEDLRRTAYKSGQRTIYGSYGWRSAVSSRIAPRTVYLGSEYVQLPKITPVQKQLIQNAPEELHKVLHLLRTLPFVHIRRRMGDNKEYNPICNLYMSMADPKNARLAFMYGSTLAPVDKSKPGPEFTMIHIPEEHVIRQQVLALPEYGVNICLGSDYMGEDKKGFLRQSMYNADELGMLGLHAGTKIVKALDARTGKLKTYGIYLFGLSATGKSTWSCHQLGMDFNKGEGTWACQDDIVFLKRDGGAYGTETGFFVKTDVDEKLQEAMYNALIDRTALYENVMIDSNGRPDFLDENLCANGRAVIRKDKLKVRRKGRLVSIESPDINLPPAEELDGIAFAFITRRNTIMPFAQKLTPEKAVLAYLWGESSHSYASQPAKAGESVRVVGTDPFIVGSRARKVNRFKKIVMELVDKLPGKVEFFQYNTGGMGEIIREEMVDGEKKKIMVRKTERVPIKLMAALQRGDLRGTNHYEIGSLNNEAVVETEGFDLRQYDIKQYYSQEQIDYYLQDLVDGRRRHTEEIASEGLDSDILKWAGKAYEIAPKGKSAKVTVPESPVFEEKDKELEKAEEYPASYIATLPDTAKLRPPRLIASRFR